MKIEVNSELFAAIRELVTKTNPNDLCEEHKQMGSELIKLLIAQVLNFEDKEPEISQDNINTNTSKKLYKSLKPCLKDLIASVKPSNIRDIHIIVVKKDNTIAANLTCIQGVKSDKKLSKSEIKEVFDKTQEHKELIANKMSASVQEIYGEIYPLSEDNN